MRYKLTASALSRFLESPKSYYWAYLAADGRGLEPRSPPSMQHYDHDLIFGQTWGEWVAAFYAEQPPPSQADLEARLTGWCDDKTITKYCAMLGSLGDSYVQQFRPDDGARTPESSERRVENERFYGYLDGMSADGVLHECKTAKRSPRLDEQLWQVQNSIQIKLYCALTRCKGVQIEFAFKDAPCAVYRAPVLPVSSRQVAGWETELNALADAIERLHEAAETQGHHAFVCDAKSCTLVTQRFVGACRYRLLCDGDEAAQHLYRARSEERR